MGLFALCFRAGDTADADDEHPSDAKPIRESGQGKRMPESVSHQIDLFGPIT
jgi:hypothetical protein